MAHDNPAPAKAASAAAGVAAQSKGQRTRLMIRAAGMLPVLVMLCVGFHFLSDGRFFTGQNLGIVLQQPLSSSPVASTFRSVRSWRPPRWPD
jgi:ribose transport system permease protein